MPRTLIWALILLLGIPGLALGKGEGVKIFERCVPCHKGGGTGMVGIYPPLVKRAPEIVLGSRSYLITVLLYGLQGKIEIEGEKTGYDGIMPSQYSLKDEEVAAVLNYVLTTGLPDPERIEAGEVARYIPSQTPACPPETALTAQGGGYPDNTVHE